MIADLLMWYSVVFCIKKYVVINKIIFTLNIKVLILIL